MKRIVGFGLAAVGVVVLAVGVAFVVGGKGGSTVYTPEWGVRAATAVMDARRGVDGVAPLVADAAAPIGPGFTAAYAEYVAGLKAVDDQKIDIGQYYEQNFVKKDTEELDEMDDPGADDGTDSQLDKFAPGKANEDKDFVQDPRIKTENHVDFMYVKDFDYSNGKYDVIPYKDANMLVEKGVFPQKYEDLISDSTNYYVYDSYREAEDGTDVLFKPLSSGQKNKIVKIRHTDSQITGFGVVE